MPVDRTLAEGLTQTLADLYGEASTRIAANMARQLKAGITSPDWAADKLGSLNDLRNAVAQLISKLDADTTGEVEQAITLAFARGGQAALDELAKAGRLTAEQVNAIRQSLPAAEALNSLVFSLTSTLRGTHVRILRWALDAYREVIAQTIATGVLMGTEPRLATAQRAWDRLVSRGITGFVDKSGRRWELTSYVEMAVRTGTAQAAVQGHLDRLGDRGIDLVIVSNAPQECVRCRPWEGKVLSRTIPGARLQLERNPATGDPVYVRVAGSVVEAVAAGLMHPNCRHSLSAYLPGITVAPTNTKDPEGDQARQKLRALERNVRKEKLAALTAFDPVAKREHEANVRALQADIRQHLDDNPGLLRQRHREQIGAGNLPPAAGRATPHRPDKPTPEPTPPAPEPTHVEKPPEHRATTKDYSTLTDDELEAALNAAAESGDDTALDAVLAQMDRRQANADAIARAKAEDQALAEADVAARAAAAETLPVDENLSPEQAAQWQRFEQLLTAGETEESAAEQVFGRGIEQQRRDRAIAQLRAQGYTGKGFDDLARKSYRDHVYQQYIAAEDATRGHMVTPAGQSAGIDPHELFTGPEARARKWASDELKQWWDNNGRMTYDQWVAGLLGGNTGFSGTTGDSFLR